MIQGCELANGAKQLAARRGLSPVACPYLSLGACEGVDAQPKSARTARRTSPACWMIPGAVPDANTGASPSRVEAFANRALVTQTGRRPYSR